MRGNCSGACLTQDSCRVVCSIVAEPEKLSSQAIAVDYYILYEKVVSESPLSDGLMFVALGPGILLA